MPAAEPQVAAGALPVALEVWPAGALASVRRERRAVMWKRLDSVKRAREVSCSEQRAAGRRATGRTPSKGRCEGGRNGHRLRENETSWRLPLLYSLPAQ